jgi:hypothetical protein
LSELVSEPKFPASWEYTGNFVRGGPECDYCLGIGPRIQRFTIQFPTHRNRDLFWLGRELIRLIRDLIHLIRESALARHLFPIEAGRSSPSDNGMCAARRKRSAAPTQQVYAGANAGDPRPLGPWDGVPIGADRDPTQPSFSSSIPSTCAESAWGHRSMLIHILTQECH